MRSSFFYLVILTFISVSQVPLPTQAADDTTELKSLQTKLRETNPKLADEFEKRLKQSQVEVGQYRQGHVVFGKVNLEGGHDPRAVVSQMIILEDGYFVDAIGATGRPIGFRLMGYETAVVTPVGPGPIEDLGAIHLKQLPPDRLCSVKGRLQLESHPGTPKLEGLTVVWEMLADPINTPSNRSEELTGHFPPITSRVAADGTFAHGKMSPGKYALYLNAPRCVQHLQEVELTEGKVNELDTIHLEMARKMKVEYGVSEAGDFSNYKFKKTSLKADDRWRASNNIPAYAYDLLIRQRGGKLVLDHRYGPCHIEDLGTVELTDELAVDLNELKRKQPQSVSVEEGHVYLIFQEHWKHWILLRATKVEMVATEKNKN